MRLVAGAAALLTLAATPGPTVVRDGTAPIARCEMPDGWDQVTRLKPRFVIFGEIHGTREAPGFVADAACALVRRGKRILVAVELSSTDNEAFQSAWRLPHRQFPAAIVKTGWLGRTDGVASEAMLNLVVRLHALRAAGRSIHIVAFNGARDDAQRSKFRYLPGQGPHEASQAENIRIAANARPFDQILILVGNFHARKKAVRMGADTIKPMAMLLAPAEQIVSLNMMTAGGTAWNCIMRPKVALERGEPIRGDAIECGNHPERGIADLNQPPFVALGYSVGAVDEAYDGYFWLGRVNGSPPVTK